MDPPIVVVAAPSLAQKKQHLGKSARVGPESLRALVFDHLANSGYSETARAFLKDSAVRHLDADGDEIPPSTITPTDASITNPALSEEDLRVIDLRRDIRMHILSGQVEEAICMLKEHFPAVLAEGQPPEPSKRPGTSNTVYYASRTSVDPSHISLNLCIHTFVEACRTVPLPYNLEQTSSASRPSAPGTSRLSNLDPSSSLAQGSVTRDEAELADLVLRAQKLHAAVHMLHKASDREMYGEELKRVCSLLAYPVPESSPMCRYLGQARREAVADQINSAILYWTGASPVSRLELYARYTTVLWSFMRDLHIKPTTSPSGQRAPSSFDLSDFVASP